MQLARSVGPLATILHLKLCNEHDQYKIGYASLKPAMKPDSIKNSGAHHQPRRITASIRSPS